MNDLVGQAHLRGPILVIDDDPFMREITRVNLEGAGYTVALAEHGVDGAVQIRALHPSAVILDFAMPGSSGLEILRDLRADAQVADTPVVMVSAWNSDDARIDAEALGAYWLEKPIMGDTLVRAVQESLSRARVASAIARV